MKIENCILGVYESLDGLDIAGEMCCWLKKYYNLIKVAQEPIEGNLFEYPALLFASDFCRNIGKPVLYLHTKGAAHDIPIQSVIRNFWKKEFKFNKDWYESQFDIDAGKPKVVCPISTGEEIAWYNGFMMNPSAAEIIHERLKIEDRYYYEQNLLKGSGIEVVGHHVTKPKFVTVKMLEIMNINWKLPKKGEK